MLVYFLVDFVTILFCDVLTQSVCFRSFNLIRSIDHLYQSNGDLILCYSRHFGVQNRTLQAEILLHVLDFELKQFIESTTMITMGARSRLILLGLNYKWVQFINMTYGSHQAINHARGASQRDLSVATTATNVNFIILFYRYWYLFLLFLLNQSS